MKNALVLGSFGIAAAFGMLALGYLAGAPGRPAVAAPQVALQQDAPQLDRAAIENIVREYLLTNPEVMVEVQAALEQRETEARKITQQETIRNASEIIFNAAYDGLIGDPDARITVVEFFDYNCGYCKRAISDMQKLVAEHKDVRFVMKEFPILGPESQRAAQVSMALHKLAPEKYAEFHTKLMSAPGRASDQAAIKLAVSMGVDETALRDAMKDPGIAAAINETYELANKLAITGTPSYVLGEEVIFGAIGYQILEQRVALLRD